MIIWVEAVGCTNGCRSCHLKSGRPHPVFYSAADLEGLAEVWGPLVLLEDVTVHPEFPEVLRRTITPQGHTYLGTNGNGIAQANDSAMLFQQLRGYGYEGLYFALHGLEYWHDWFVGQRGAFQAVLQASHRASDAGFYVHWEVYLNRNNLGDVVPLIELAGQVYGGLPRLNFLNHRIHPHLWWYETLRPTLGQVRDQLPEEVVAKRWGESLATLSEASWLSAWQDGSAVDQFRHFFEPKRWPVDPLFENRCVSITRDRRIFFNVQCSVPVFLGELSEGRGAIMERLNELPEPSPALNSHWPGFLREEDRDLLHASGFSVRYKAASAMARSEREYLGAGALDFCGHF